MNNILHTSHTSNSLEFKSLSLKKYILRDLLGLPYRISNSNIKLVQVKIPWTSLSTDSIQVLVDGIYLTASPLDTSDYDKVSQDEVDKEIHDLKEQILQAVEAMTLSILLKDKDEQASAHVDNNFPSINPFLLKFLLKIVKNIVVVVKNVHIRYEDDVSIPSVKLAVGLTIDQLSVMSESDELARLNQKNVKYIPKNITIADLCIYHNATNTSSPSEHPVHSWEQSMQSLIYNRTTNKTENNYIVNPVGLHIKLTYDNTDDNAQSAGGNASHSIDSKAIKKLGVVITSDSVGSVLSVKMDKIYLLQYCKLIDYYSKVNRRKYLRLLRPIKRPNEDPRAWWKYAMVLLTGKEDDILLTTAVTSTVEKYQKRYLDLTKKDILYDIHSSKQKNLSSIHWLRMSPTKRRDSIVYLETFGIDSSAIGVDSSLKNTLPLSKDESVELRQLTRELPIQALIILRQVAMREVIIISKVEKTVLKSRPSAGSSRIRRLYSAVNSIFHPSNTKAVEVAVTDSLNTAGGSSATIGDGDILLENLITDAETVATGDAAANLNESHDGGTAIFDLISISLELSVRFVLVSDCNNMLELKVDGLLSTVQVAKMSNVTAEIAIRDIYMHDMISNEENRHSLPTLSICATDPDDKQRYGIYARYENNLFDANFPVFKINSQCINFLSNHILCLAYIDYCAFPYFIGTMVLDNWSNLCNDYYSSRIIIPKESKDSSYFELLKPVVDPIDYLIKRMHMTVDINGLLVHIPQQCFKEVGYFKMSIDSVAISVDVINNKDGVRQWNMKTYGIRFSLPSSLIDNDSKWQFLGPFDVELDAPHSDKHYSALPKFNHVQMLVKPEKINLSLNIEKLCSLIDLVQYAIIVSDDVNNLYNSAVMASKNYRMNDSSTFYESTSFRLASIQRHNSRCDSFNRLSGKSDAEVIQHPSVLQLLGYDCDYYLRSTVSEPDVLSVDIGFCLDITHLFVEMEYARHHAKRYCLIIDIRGVHVQSTERVYDKKLEFHVDDFSLMDTKRPAMYTTIVKKKVATTECALVSGAVIQSTSAYSPYFSEYGKGIIIDVSIAGLDLSVDSNFIYEVKEIVMTTTKKIYDIQSRQYFRISKEKSNAYWNCIYQAPKQLVSNNSALLYTIGSVKRMYLHPVDITPELELVALELSMQLIDLNIILASVKVTNTSTANNKVRIKFEDVYRVSLQGLDVHYLNYINNLRTKLHSGRVFIKSLDIYDIREMSKDHFFHQVLSTSVACVPTKVFAGSDHSNCVGSTKKDEVMLKQYWWMQRNKSPTSNYRDRNVTDNYADATSESDYRFLELNYIQQSRQNHGATCVCNNLIINGSIDTFLDMGNVTINIAYAVMSLIFLDSDNIVEYKPGTSEKGSPTITKSIENNDAKAEAAVVNGEDTDTLEASETDDKHDHKVVQASKKLFGLSLHLSLPNLCFVILDDPSDELSKGMLLQAVIDVTFNTDVWLVGTADSEAQEAMHITAQCIELFTLNNVNEWIMSSNANTKLKEYILKPSSVDIHFTRRLMNEVVLHANVSLNTSNMDLLVTIDTVALLQSIISSRTLTGVTPPTSAGMKYCVFGRRTRNKGTQVDIYSLAINVGQVTVNAFSITRDANDNTVAEPIIQFRLLTFLFRTDGALLPRVMVDNMGIYMELDVHNIEGDGIITVECDFYNSVISMWEPMLETYSIDLGLKKEKKALNFDVITTNTLQLNVSGKMLDVLITAYQDYVKRVEEISLRVVKSMTRSHATQVAGFANNVGDESVLNASGTSDAIAIVHKNERNSSVYACGRKDTDTFVLHNRLLCDINYILEQPTKTVSKSSTISTPEIVSEEGLVRCGDSVSLGRFDTSLKPLNISICLYLSKLGRSSSNIIGKQSIFDRSKVIKLDFYSKEGDEPEKSIFTVCAHYAIKELTNGVLLEVTIFSNSAVIDRTGCGLSVKASRRRFNYVERSTANKCSLNGSIAQCGEQWLESYRHVTANEIASSNALVPLKLTKFSVLSRRSYNIMHIAAETNVYSDRDIKFLHVPVFLQHALYIQSPCSDYASKVSNLLEIKANRTCVLLLLFEASSMSDVKKMPLWVQLSGFHRLMHTAIGRRATSNGINVDHHFIIFGKIIEENEVTLGGMESVSLDGFNYSVALVDIISLYANNVGIKKDVVNVAGLLLLDRSDAAVQNYWIEGSNGLSLFHSDDEKCMIGVPDALSSGTDTTIRRVGNSKDKVWSDEIDLTHMSSSSLKMPVELNGFQFVYSVSTLPGLLSRTRLLTIMPRYCIINCMDEKIYVKQDGCDTATEIKPYDYVPWHKSDPSKGTKVALRCESSMWSHKCFDINEVGTSLFLLPSSEWFASSTNHNAVVAHVEVKMAEPTENCAAVIVIWKSSWESSSGLTLSIKNDSFIPLTLTQAGIFSSSDAETEAKYTVCVAPGSWIPFGWADPDAPQVISVIVGTPPFTSDKKICNINILKMNEILRMDIVTGKGQVVTASEIDESDPGIINYDRVYLVVQPFGSGKIIRIANTTHELIEYLSTQGNSNASSTLERQSSITSESHAVSLSMDNTVPIENSEMTAEITTTSSALVAGGVVGSLLLGPFAGVLLAGGAVYAARAHLTSNKKQAKGAKVTRRMEEEMQLLYNNDRQQQELMDQDDETSIFKVSSIFSVQVIVKIKSISISVIVEKPMRRELLCLYIDNFWTSVHVEHNTKSLELSIGGLQIDSYSETSTSPVFVHIIPDTVKGKDGVASPDTTTAGPVIHIIVVEEIPKGSVTPHFKYIAAKILEVKVVIDSASLQLLVLDLGCDFNLMSKSNALAYQDPISFIHEYNNSILNAETHVLLVDMFRSQVIAMAPRVYIENLILHPIKLTITFTQTTLPRKVDNDTTLALAVTALSYIPPFVSLEAATVKINSFIVDDAMESAQSILQRILVQALHDIQFQVAKLAGSLNVIGKPVGFARKVGSGVQAFFYEPYEGAMRSPSSFVMGIGKGAKGLVGGLVGGVLSSSAAIVSTASQGISQGMVFMSGDNEEFAQQRIESRRKAQEAARAGVYTGLKRGAYSVGKGFAAGFTGIITRPFQGAVQKGTYGFLTGVGKGVIGVAVNPVLGVTDGLNSVAQTIYYNSSDNKALKLRRPPRTLDCILVPINSPVSSKSQVTRMSEVRSYFLLTPIDMLAINAQSYVRTLAAKINEFDYFVGYLLLASDQKHHHVDHGSVILTCNYLYYRKPNAENGSAADRANSRSSKSAVGMEVLSFPWQIISHCSWVEGNHFVDVLTNTNVFSIPCGSALKAVVLYQLLYENSPRMKNPGYMTGLVNIENVCAQESVSVEDTGDIAVSNSDRYSFHLSLFLPISPYEINDEASPSTVESKKIETVGSGDTRGVESPPKPTASTKHASTKVQAFTTQYAILLSIRARDFPFGNANMNVFDTLPDVNDASVPDIKNISSNGSIDKSLLSIDSLPTNKIIESFVSTMNSFGTFVVNELNAGSYSDAQVKNVWTKLDDIMWNVCR